MTALWHPFADMSAVAGNELVLVRGEGVFVWDEQGRRYLDGASSLWYANVGHGRREIAEAVAAQLAELETFHVFGEFANRPALEVAERLAGLAPQPGSKVFLTSGGGDSIESALKLARLYHDVRGEPGRTHLLSRANGYHGTHGIGTSILGLPGREGFGPLVAQTSLVEWDSVGALEEEIARLGAETIAAFVYEPVIGSGGVLPPPPGYLEGVEELCRRHGILTVADIVIGGFGRLGEWLAVERFGLTPDLIVFAKGVTSGYLPLGGVIVAPNVAEPFWDGEERSFAHGATYSGHATCCAAALANLDLLARDGLVHRARELEAGFHARLAELESHPLVGGVRGGVGLMAAVALDDELLARDPDAASRFRILARDAGLLTRGLRDGVALAPPLIVEDAHVELALEALAIALNGLA
ncbi:MAG: putrescine---pyruvate transaminase [Gaiellaceae bacterium]|nr:putrescine---pyruvate transaminase [Gaiellaceae bacterium]